MEQVVETPQATPPVAPASGSEEPSPKAENQPGTEATGKEVETEETPQRRESRRQRQLNRERDRRIAAETELRLLREQQARQQPQSEATKADDEPKRDQFASYEEFIEARATWKAEKAAEEKARKILEENRSKADEERSAGERDKLHKAWNAQVEKARDDIDDFEEVCAESTAIVTKPMSEAILESDKGALIAYHLAKNPAEAERISKLSPSKQAAAIVALEEKVGKPAKQPSNAPPPIAPVGQKAEVQKNPAEMSDKEYEAYRRRRRAAKGL